ncbi:type II toxin-antitoxin system YafQ family toxin [uncultured Helicobacter sp.]
MLRLLKKLKNNAKALECTKEVITKLANDESLAPKHRDHNLQGKHVGL